MKSIRIIASHAEESNQDNYRSLKFDNQAIITHEHGDHALPELLSFLNETILFEVRVGDNETQLMGYVSQFNSEGEFTIQETDK